MSRKVSSNNSSAPIQKFCKVCQDAGKLESEYRSHFIRETRDPNSRVVCPTLLALECRFCFKKGHTIKYCVVLKKCTSHEAPRTQVVKKPEVKPKGKSVNHNTFAVLDSDSEEEEEVVPAKKPIEVKKPIEAKKPIEVKEEFPALSALSLTRNQSVSTNYAAALLRPAPKVEVIAPFPLSIKNPVDCRAAPKAEAKPAPWASGASKVPTTSWGAWDSDSEEEEDESESPICYKSQFGVNEEFDEDW